MVASDSGGMFSASSTAAFQASAALVASPVRDALDASVTKVEPPDNDHASQVSIVPLSSPVERSGSTWPRMLATLVALWLGASRNPSAASTRQSPTVRRSCQP